MQNSSTTAAEEAIINVLRTFEAAANRYWLTARSAKFVDEANHFVEDYESGHEIDWTSVLNLIVNFHTEMGEWCGSN